MHPTRSSWLCRCSRVRTRRDGEATVHEKFVVDAGQRVFGVTMRDGTSDKALDYTASHSANLQPGRLLVIDSDRVSDGFSFR